jgi:hypothetical protein
MQHRRVPVCTEESAEELANDGDRAPLVEHERRQARRLIDASTDAYAG